MDANRMFIKDRTDREIIFTLRDPSVLYEAGFRALEEQAGRVFVPCQKTLSEGQLRLVYDISGCRALAELLPGWTPPAFRAFTRALLGRLNMLRGMGFARGGHVYSAPDHIFVEPATLAPRLLYLPLVGGAETDFLSPLEKKLKELIIRIANTQPNVVDKETIEMLKAMHAGGMGAPVEPTGAPVENESSSDGTADCAALIGEDPAFPLKLRITKDDYMIGRSREQADGVVLLSIRISRLHCRILRRGGAYYVVDMQSANGTFLNGARLTPHQETPLSSGDKITLADVPLVFTLPPKEERRAVQPQAVPPQPAPPPPEPQPVPPPAEVTVAAVFSPVGGAGCTTVALALAIALARRGRRVLYVGADSLQNFTFLLGDVRLREGAEKLLAWDDLGGGVLAALEPHIRGIGGFDYLPPFRQSLSALGVSGGDFIGLCQSVREAGAYDTVLLDCSGEFSERTTRLLVYADLRLILCRQEEHAVRKLLQFLRLFDTEAGETLLVCNRYDNRRENALLRAQALLPLAAYIEEISEAAATLEALRGLERQVEGIAERV